MSCQQPAEPEPEPEPEREQDQEQEQDQDQDHVIDMNCSCPYPLDFWFQISSYIDPEDVERFARICKHCASIVRSASFWLSLYKRFYRSDIPLPPYLQPAAMTRRHGLRTRVIRALYFLYMPMTRRLQDPTLSESRLLDKMCVQQCHKYHFAIGCSTFIFKFQDVKHIPVRGQEPVEKEDDIYANSDEGAITLKLTCSQITTPPLVLIGLVLRSITFPTPADPGAHVQISVGDNYVASPPKISIVLNKVIAVQMTDWWHPCFSHTHPFQSILHPCYADPDELLG
ncbi:transmembrane protein 183-like isoform X2 [Schistocerca americana]|uniref:transmembrane protein 183-like isoform X2 n=1 Tax=Schistocerca americana TaxID=7009 RepID=UPI001F4F4B46|nr:transmembrane protein 183-like isoform X2 [Schistocerca americana]